MSNRTFWLVISRLDWRRTGDDAAVLAPAIDDLSRYPEAEILRFQDLLADKLFALDTLAHAREIGTAAYCESDEPPFSADDFLYARCSCIANGRAFYESVLRNPALMPKDVEFESILGLAPGAWKCKTGTEMNHVSPRSFETFANRSGWHPAPHPRGDRD